MNWRERERERETHLSCNIHKSFLYTYFYRVYLHNLLVGHTYIYIYNVCSVTKLLHFCNPKLRRRRKGTIKNFLLLITFPIFVLSHRNSFSVDFGSFGLDQVPPLGLIVSRDDGRKGLYGEAQ